MENNLNLFKMSALRPQELDFDTILQFIEIINRVEIDKNLEQFEKPFVHIVQFEDKPDDKPLLEGFIKCPL